MKKFDNTPIGLLVILSIKAKSCYNNSEFDILLNLSFYTIFLELFLITLTIGFMIYKKNKN